MDHHKRQAQIELTRGWLAGALGVPVSRVLDEDVFAWERLAGSIKARGQNRDQARGVRAISHQLGVAPSKAAG